MFPSVPADSSLMPMKFPEMRLPAPGALPPIRLFAPPWIRMPLSVLPSAEAPAASVPTRLPWTVVPPARRKIPSWFPEIRLPAPGADPPIVLSGEPTRTPVPFPAAEEPDAFVPM